MLNKFFTDLVQNKNLLMLVTVCIYILALYSTLSGKLFLFTFLFSVILIIFVIKKSFPIKYIIVWLIVFYFGAINTSLRLRNVDDLLNMAPINCNIEGTVVSIPQGKTEGKLKFFFKVDKIIFRSTEKNMKNEKVLVMMNESSYNEKIKLYSSGKLEGRLSLPFKAGNPSQFDYSTYLQNHNAYAVFYANSFVEVIKKKTLKEKFMSKINEFREDIISVHAKYLKSPNIELLGGIVFGDDAVSPPKTIKQSFVNSGLLHILAASGMNVAFIYSFFFLLTSILRVNFKAKVSLGIIMVIIYALMTGLGPSIIRATAMLVLVLIGKLIDRDAHNISLLSFVALLMLIYNPLYINDVGFQLSFIVTFGLLLMTPAIARAGNNFLNYIISAVSIPVIAQLWVIPVQIFYFNNISIYSIFANIMSVPILAVISFGGFVSSLLSVIKPFADFVCKIFDFILNPFITLLIGISDFWGNLPNSTIQTTHPDIFQIILYYGILLCISALLYKDFREKYLTKILKTFLILLVILLLTLIPFKNSNLEILAFDVGNADCFLIKTPKNEYIMIDTGKNGYKGGKSQAEIIVLKYFKDKGIKSLDSLIVSHFDNDHCGGVVDLLNTLKVNKIYVNDLEHSSNSAKKIYDTAKKHNVEIILAKNQQIVYENNNFRLVNYLGVNRHSDNENSIITLLNHQKFTMLFTGDVNASGIKAVLNYLPKGITVLKVPHHGANDGLDKQVLDYLKPEYSLISVGQNKFGHPSMQILNLLKETNIIRTDIHNAILFKINNKAFKIYNYDTKKRKFLAF